MRGNLFKRRRGAPHPVAAKSRGMPRDVSFRLERLEDRIAPAVITPFTVRFAANTTGDTAIIGNTLETASTVGNPGRTQQDVTNAQNGTGSFVSNNDWNMAYVDVDSNPSTFDSSQASLNLPNGASVLFAGLYWVGNSSSAQRNTVMLSTPASGAYTTLTGKVIGDTSTVSPAPAPSGPNYEGFADVTSLVQTGGNGAYTVANVQATNGTNYYAGWSMIVAFRAPGLPARNLTVFDGYGVIQSNDPALNIPISGFIAPPSGTVNAKISVVAAEGDLGLTGDTLKMNGTILSNSLNPSTNFFNSSITNAGTPLTAKNPNFTNQLGFDADSVLVPAGVIANNATTASVTLTTNGDTYFPGVVATTIDLYAPKLDAVKTVTDLSGGNNLPGDTLEYVVNVTNNGQDPAGNVILNDPIPANTTFVPGSLRIASGANSGTKTDVAGDDQARFDSANNQVVFTLGTGATASLGGSLAIGATTSIVFDVKVNNNVAANTVITNQATLNYTGLTTGFAFTSLSSAPGFTVTNSFADIAVTKTVSNATPNVGDAVTFTVMATNNGPGPAPGVNVVDLLPAGLQLTNATTTQGVYSGASGLWTIGSLANGANAILTIFATVIGSTTQTNTATLSHTDSIDSISSNNQASAALTPLVADLAVTKTVDSARPNVGDTVTFLVTVAGNGPNPATNVQLTDLLPAGLSFVSSTASTGTTYNSTSGLWTVGTITNGGNATLQLKARVVDVSAQVNTASVTHSDVFDPNTANNSASVTVTPQQADLKISKTVNNASPNVGDNITFLVTLTNLGPDFATGVTVQDLLPVGLTYVSARPSQGIYNPISGQWTVGVVDPLSPRTLVLVATVVSSAALTNRASVSHADQFDPDSTHDSDSVTETPQQADLVVTKTVDNVTPNVGDTITFTVTVKNNGPNGASNVNVNDLLPTGLAYISNTVSQGNYFSTTGAWTVGILGNGAQATLTLTAKVASQTAQTNTATATADQFDPNSANNSESVTETPQQADLAVTKTVNDDKPNVGDNITFTIIVANNGPNSATNVTVQELFGSGLAFVSAAPTQGTYDSTSGVWTVGTVGLIGAPTLLIVARVTNNNVVTNSASIKHSDQFDPISSNNSDSIAVKGSQTDLAVTKTVDRSTAAVGETVNFTITVTNLDGSAANSVQVTDMLSAGLQFVSFSTTDGTYNNVSGIWALAGTLNQGSSSTLTIQATMLTTTAQTNTATVTNSSKPDPNLGNNSGDATVNPATADLIVSKFVNDPNPNIGANITYTIQVTNSGPDTATNVTLQDTLPAGVSFVSSSASQGSYDSVTGQWTIGTISVGTPQTLQIVCTVTRLLPGPNTASISHSDEVDPVPANNTDSASITPLSADLAITKTVSNNRPNVGDTIFFTVTLTNTGPASATNVSVTDLLPTGLTLVGNSPNQGAYAPATGLWTIGTMASSATVILTLQAQVVSSAPLTNTANISHSDQFDPNTANNSDTATETPQQSDLEVFKFVDNSTPNVGDTVTFTIDIENIGPSAATNVLLNDLLPTGLAFLSSVPSQGSYNPSTGVWNVGTMPDGFIATLTVSAQVVNSGVLTNIAAIGRSDQPDPNTANNQASATVTTLQADLLIAKTVSNSRPNVGDTIVFTVTLTDLGPGLATNVQVTDLLPTGLTLVSFVPSQGTYDPATGVWSIPTVTTALARTLILDARVDGPDPRTNTATITASDVFDPNSGNDTASATETPLQADLGLTKTVSNAHPNFGDTITYTVTLTNAGLDGATHVQVSDLLPAGLDFVSATPNQGTYSEVTGLWDVGAVAASALATLQIQAQVVSSSQQLNTATISQTDQFDPDSANNSAGALETPQRADLSVRKSVSNPTPNVGDTLTYTLRISNNGPDAATGVVLSDVLPAGVNFQSSSATAGTYDPTTRSWTVGAVANGDTQTLTILASVVNISPHANTATISRADQFDPNSGNNFDTASINPLQADLQLAKTVSDPTPNVGETITFTVTLTNDGPSAASNVQVTDLLPSGLSFVSATPSPGTTYDSVTGLWTVGTVTTTTPQSLTIRAQVVSPAAQTNTAAVIAADEFDPDPANNQAGATETPQQADLVIAKAVSDQKPNVGDTVTFVVAVADRGPNAATNVTVQDLLPAGLSLVSFALSRGTYDPTTGIWAIGSVDPSAAQTLTLIAQVTGASPAINTATISHSDQFDPDTGNNSASASVTPQQADLSVAKTVSNATPNVGDVITYTVILTNKGRDSATDVQVTDLLPAGLTLLLATPSQGVYSSAIGLWTVGQVDTTAPAKLTLRARVAGPAPATNVATVTHSDQFDPDTSNNTASATEIPRQADLQITKTVSDPTPNVGDTITFVVTVNNKGPSPATHVVVLDRLPSGVGFISAVPSQGVYDPVRSIWAVGTVAAGASQTLTFIAQVISPAARTNTAVVGHSDQFDPDTANNTASATETPQQSDLQLSKTVSDPTPNVGDTITYTLTLTNNGPDAATGVAVHDLLPAGVAFVSATPAGSYDPASGVWTVGTVDPGTPQTLTITATVTSPAAQTNSAAISAADQFDPQAGNNTSAATETPQQSDLQITKTVSDPTPNVGDTITYTITLANNGPDAATNVTVQDLLPAGVAFVSATPAGSYDPVSGVWTVGTVDPGTPQTLIITVTVVSASPGTNSASVSHADQFDPNTANNSDTASVNPLEADLALSKTVNNAHPNVGETITFTVTLADGGPADATGVEVTDLLPAGLTLVLATPSLGTTYDSVTGLWIVGSLANGAQATLALEARVDSPDRQTNTAAISAADQFDPVTGNDSASATETPQRADLALSKSVNLANPNVGNVISFTVTLTNNGPDAASNVQVADPLPIGLVFVEAVPSQGTYDDASGAWVVGTVTTAAPQTLLIRARVVSPDPRTNTATINSVDQFDPVGVNNSASATETPQQADLALTKTVDNPTPNVGDIITFTVTLTNRGPDLATNVEVQDVLPSGLTFLFDTPSQGIYTPFPGVWDVGTVTTDTPQTLRILARVDSPIPRINTADVLIPDQFDPDTTNNSASVLETPQQADLAVAKTVSDARPDVGDTITFIVTLTNAGPDPATNVEVTDLLPAGLTYLSASSSQGAYASATGIWVVGTVTPGAPQTLQIEARVDSPAAQTNTASITASDQFDPQAGNNMSSATETPQQSDLAVTKSVSDPTPNVGDTITFTINLTNAGPDAATGVTVQELLPAGLSFVSGIPTQGSYDNATGVWTVGTVTVAAPASLAIEARVDSPDPQINTARISAAGQFDPNTANNQASVGETPQQADLAVSKTVDDPAPNVGDTVTFTVTLSNAGPDTATNVVLTDLLPPGLTFVSDTPSQGNYDSATGLWTVGDVVTTATPTLVLAARVDGPGSATNTAFISHSDQFDPVDADNTSGATETPQQADLAITKTVSDPNPNVGDTITFIVTLSNLGPSSATNVRVNDLLPVGLNLVSDIPSQGTYDSATGVWSVGTVDTSLAPTLTLTATVAGPGTLTNTATILGADQFDPDSGNNQAAAAETPQQADLGLTKTVSDAHPNVGDTISYTVSLSNDGLSDATDVHVTDLLPAGLSFVNSTVSLGVYNSLTGLWTVGSVAFGAVETLQMLARVNSPAPQFNMAFISAADQFDPDTTNNTAGALETPQQADLEVGKSVSDPAPNVGDTITYTVHVTNNGPDDATGVTVEDVLPAGVAYQSSSATAGAYDPSTRIWTVGGVAAGATQTLTITATVTGADPQTNTATITGADQFDPNTANNTDTTSIDPQAANLALGKTVSDSTPNVGETIIFTVTLSNNGPDSATNVKVADLLPAGLTFVSSAPSQGTYDSATGIWTVGTVTTTAPQTLTITATVASPAAQTNSAIISAADQFDPDAGNNTASATETPQQSDLLVSKTVNDARPNVGETITFTVTLSNGGPDSATNVRVNDLLPAGLTFVLATPSQGTYDSVTGVWTVGTVDPGFARTLVLQALVVGSAPATNTASVGHSDQFDPNAANNTAGATETPQQADVSITKTVSNPTPNVGDVVIFTVTVNNSGPDPATNVQLTDLLPTGLTLVLATPSQGAYSSATGLWTVGQVDTTAPATLTLRARVAGPAPVTNVATITHSDQFDPNTGNNSASATETPQQADLQITKTVSDPTPNVGDTITFIVTVTNNGPDAATDVVVLDRLPSGLGFISAVPSQGVYDPIRSIWAVGTVAPGVAQTLTFTAEVIDSEARTNTARVGHSDQFDPNTGDNQASATETPQQSDLQLSKTVSDPTPNVGDTITFTVTLTNAGPDPATGVAVHDLLPAGLTFVSATPAGSYDPVGGVWTVGTVDPGTPQTLTITATVAVPGALTNTAAISAADQFDPQTGNNTSSATETPQQADLQVSKTVSDPKPNVGDTITYTITLTNNGPDAATAVTVQDMLPAGVAFVSATPVGSYDPVSGVWTVGTVNPGTPQTLTINATVVSPAPGANSASIDHSDQFDPNPGNDSDTASVNPLEANLALSKTVSNARPNVGDTVTFTVTLTDNGPANATGVEVTDLLPAGLTFVSDTPSQGTYDGVTGLWTVGALVNGAQATLTLDATVDSPAPQTNTATISAADQFDPVTGNDSASATETPQQADLALTKSVNLATPNVGDVVEFTVTLTNVGPDAATNVQVDDLLPGGLVFVDDLPSQGTYDGASGIWMVGTVTTAAPQTLLIRARVVSPDPRTNTATINSADQFDPIGANDSASATETPQQANLALTKTVDNPTPNVGDIITFTVTLTNRGPDMATNVEVQDVLPSGLTFVIDKPSQGTYTPFPGVWNLGTVTTDTPQTLKILARVDSPIPRINTADILLPDQFDPDMTNNSASVIETPQQADLALIKMVSDPTPNVGDTISFTVTLTNGGPDPATNVEVNDLLPAGLTFLTAVASQGAYADATGIWVVGTVTPGAPQTLQIEVRVDSPDAQTNTATITQADQFDPQTGNDQASATETPQQSDLALAKTVSDPTPNVGDTITFTVTLTNAGPDAATGVTVQELLPAGLSFVSGIPTQGSYDNATGVWTVGTVTVATPASLAIQARVDSPDPQTNTALISAADQFDPQTGNDQAAVTETPQRADLALAKTVSDPRPNVGDTITFTVTLTNAGPDAATNVRVNDLLPAGLTFVLSTPSQGTYDNVTGLWTVGTVTTAAPQTLTIRARVDSPDAQTNTASVGHSDQFDPQKANNQAGVAETPQRADLALSKTVSNSTPNVGDVITFTVTLTNSGPDSATGVQVNDPLPAGLSFVSAAPSQGTYDAATGVWAVSNVAPSTSHTLQIQARVVGTSPQANTASVGHSDQFDPVAANSSATATATPQTADLAVIKTAGPGPFAVGQQITYALTVTNRGPSDDPDVVLVDQLPVGVTFVSASVPPASQSSGSLTFSLGTLSAGVSATVIVVVRVDEAGALVNQASASGALPDIDPSNDAASVTTTVSQTAPTVVSLQRFGFHEQPTSVVLVFSEPLDPGRAQDLGNYRLILIAHGGRLHLPVRLSRAVYDATSRTVTLQPARLLPLRFRYMLTVNATSSTGVSGASGVLLDGDRNGQPGGNYVRTFGRGILAGPNRPAGLRGHGLVRLSPPGPTEPVRLPGRRTAHAASAGPRHVGTVASATGRFGSDLHPSAVDAVLEAIVVRHQRK